jgi:RNA polymerase sigma-70 factor (ECF subfamily)
MTREAAFGELYTAHYRQVRALCRQLLGSAANADDAAQESFIRAYRNFASYDAAQPFGGWIMTIARHHCLDVIRRRGLERAHFGAEAEEVAAAEAAADDGLDALLGAERADAVNAAIATLPERYRLPLVLAYFSDASYDEIATALGITRTHVGALLCRAKQTLRQQLTEEALP